MNYQTTLHPQIHTLLYVSAHATELLTDTHFTTWPPLHVVKHCYMESHFEILEKHEIHILHPISLPVSKCSSPANLWINSQTQWLQREGNLGFGYIKIISLPKLCIKNIGHPAGSRAVEHCTFLPGPLIGKQYCVIRMQVCSFAWLCDFHLQYRMCGKILRNHLKCYSSVNCGYIIV